IYNVAKNKDELVILKTFQSANIIIPTLSTELPISPKDKLTTAIENTDRTYNIKQYHENMKG
ncbi:3515_t:CDS:2, partial [Racocetra persica]